MKKNIYLLTFLLLIGEVVAPLKSPAQSLYEDSLRIDRLPSLPYLPNPLVLDEGGENVPVITQAQWQQKKKWIKEKYQYWVSGSRPPAPKTFHAKILSSKITEAGVRDQMVELSFGPGGRAKMTVELMIPPSSDSSLPVFMTQWNHRGWAQVAVRRGYIGCVYAGADAKDDTKDYGEIFAGYDFAKLMRRAWGASRVVDYLYTLSEVDTSCIALTGHSRNGKQSLMAAAFDDRIKAVVSSSGGTGGENTFRYSDDRFTPGSFDRMVTVTFPHWFSPRLPLFIGREQKLPVDQNSLMSLIAPRGLMMVSAITEHEGNPWGIERSYKSVKTVYHFLHADSNVAILLRRGRHQHAARDIEDYLDFFDYIFDRSSISPENKLYYNYSFKRWKKLSGEHINLLDFPKGGISSLNKDFDPNFYIAQRDSIQKEIHWLLGDKPPGIPADQAFSPNLDKNRTYEDDYLTEVIGQIHFNKNSGIKTMRIGPYHSLGDDLWGQIFFPPGSVKRDTVTRKLPLVIYLHKYAYATGYHNSESARAIKQFLNAGYAVLAFDMIGFGTRIEESLHFYDRYPRWSKMGKMVSDTKSIISDAYYRMPFIDSSQIYLVGYSLGGTVALFTAALDKRVKGVAAAAAFSSFRNDNKGTEGIRHYYDLHGLIPHLGFFSGHEHRIPIDFEDILSCIAPRPLFVIAPELDRDHSIKSVDNIVSIVGKTYRNSHSFDQLSFKKPDDYNHFTLHMQKQVAGWLIKERNINASRKN